MKSTWHKRCLTLLCRLMKMFVPGFCLAILCFWALNVAMEPVSTSSYCGSACHEMNVSYQTWELSSHGTNEIGMRVDCIDCHLPPREDFFHHVAAKAYAGGKDLYMHSFGGPYDRQVMIDYVKGHISNQRCLHCHGALLIRSSSSAARQAHTAVFAHPEAPENRCVECHTHVGHERENRLFKP